MEWIRLGHTEAFVELLRRNPKVDLLEFKGGSEPLERRRKVLDLSLHTQEEAVAEETKERVPVEKPHRTEQWNPILFAIYYNKVDFFRSISYSLRKT